MLLQAKALTTAAEWAQAYAELSKLLAAITKEKDTLISVTKEKDAQLAVLTEENRILVEEKDALVKDKDVLAKQLAAAIGTSTGRSCTLVCHALYAL